MVPAPGGVYLAASFVAGGKCLKQKFEDVHQYLM